MILNPIIADRLYEAWERHGEFGPAFMEVYEGVMSTVDKLEEHLGKHSTTPDEILAAVRSYKDVTTADTRAVRCRALLVLRQAGLSLQVIARLVDATPEEVAAKAHNLALASTDAKGMLRLDELLVEGKLTAAQIATETGLPPATVRRIADAIGRELPAGQKRTSSDAALLMLRQLHYVAGLPKWQAFQQTQKVHPELSKGSAYSALRTPNGVCGSTERGAS